MKLKHILFIAITAVLFGVFLSGNHLCGHVPHRSAHAHGPGYPGVRALYGIWFMAAVFITYVIQKPGVGLIAEMLASFLEVLMGNMFGPIIFLSGLIQGLGSEVAFAAFRYKKFGYPQTMLAAVGCTVFSYIWTGIRQGYHTFAPGSLIAIFAIRLLSSLLFCGVLCKLLGGWPGEGGRAPGLRAGRQAKLTVED